MIPASWEERCLPVGLPPAKVLCKKCHHCWLLLTLLPRLLMLGGGLARPDSLQKGHP